MAKYEVRAWAKQGALTHTDDRVKGVAMPVKSAFCTACDGEVELSDDQALTCPVCSSPFIQTSTAHDGRREGSYVLGRVGPEIFLG
jgi:hypothetical protein